MSDRITVAELIERLHAAEAYAAAARTVAHKLVDAAIDDLADEMSDGDGDMGEGETQH